MNKTVLLIGIIFLLIGASVVTSTGTIVEDTHIEYPSMDSIDVSEEELSSGKIAYGSEIFSPYNLVKFPLDDPSNIEIIGPGDNTYFLPGGTWSYEHGWFACEYNSGGLWLIDPETGWMENIGGGGVCSELAWDDWTSELYSACIQGLAFNSEGICYGIDGYGSDYYLYIVDFDPYEETLIGPLINFPSQWGYPLDAEFDKDTDILYILSTQGLHTCDTETCECTFIGNTGGLKLTAFAIPYEDDPPVTTILFNPETPDGDNGWYVTPVTVTLEAMDDMNEVNTTYYSINSGPWVIYEEPFLLTEDSLYDIVYFSVDDAGNIEFPKLATVKLDQTPPLINLKIKIIRGNPIQGWMVQLTVLAIDNMSGMERVEFYLNDALQKVINGPGPFYNWSFTLYFDGPVRYNVTAFDHSGLQTSIEGIPKISNERFVNRFPFMKVILQSILNIISRR